MDSENKIYGSNTLFVEVEIFFHFLVFGLVKAQVNEKMVYVINRKQAQ